jgi:hypothetical protein
MIIPVDFYVQQNMIGTMKGNGSDVLSRHVADSTLPVFALAFVTATVIIL